MHIITYLTKQKEEDMNSLTLPNIQAYPRQRTAPANDADNQCYDLGM